MVPPDAGFGHRGRRATELITSQAGSLDYQSLRAVSLDTYLLTAKQVVATTLDVYDEIGAGIADPKGLLADVISALRTWDMTPDLDDTTASVVLFFGELVHAAAPVNLGAFPSAAELTEAQKQGLMEVWKSAAEELFDTYGSLDVPLATVNVLARGGKEFGVGTFGGQWQPLRMASCDTFRDGKCLVASGSSYLMLTELGPDGVVRSESLFPLSESEEPTSRHHTDITEMYAKGEYKPAYFDLQDVLDNAESAIEIEAIR